MDVDLIRRVQVSLRSQAGLSSYDSDDPILPSLSQSVAAFDPSPPDHRCGNCHGRLLRGPHSAVCVYCGRRRRHNEEEEGVVPPEPIEFRSTVGCWWLLQSLGLDGSEIVEPPIEEQGVYRGQSTAKDRIPLSDLLNLKILWPAESEIVDHILSKKEYGRSKTLANMAGVDLNNFFTNLEKLVLDLGEDQAATNKQTEGVKLDSLPGQDNVGFFPTAQHSRIGISSSGINDNDDLSGWQADFQSADSGSQLEASKSLDPVASSSIDLSAHMDSVFGSEKQLEMHKSKDVSTPSVSGTSNWTQDDLRINLNTVSSAMAEQVESRINADNRTTPNFEWSSNDQWQTHSTITTGNKPTTGGDDSSDVWDDYANYTNAQAPSKGSFMATDNMPAAKDSDWFPDDQWQTHSGIATEKKPTPGGDDALDIWDDFTSSTNSQAPSKIFSTTPENKPTAQDNDTFDVWNDFTTFSNAQDFSRSSSVVTDHKPTTVDIGSSNVWNEFTSSSSAQDFAKSSSTVTHNKPACGDGDSSDFWDDFTSFSNSEDPSKSSLTQSSIESAAVGKQISDAMIPISADNFQEMDFGKFSQPDIPSGSISNQNSVQGENRFQPEVSASNRSVYPMAGESVGIENAGIVSKGRDDLNSAIKSEDDKEKLFLEMHDLSFMLKTELSVPSTKDDLNLSHDSF